EVRFIRINAPVDDAAITEIGFIRPRYRWVSLHELLVGGEVDLVARRPSSLWSNRLVLPGIDVSRPKPDSETKVGALPEGVSLRGRRLEGAVLIGARLSKVDFTAARLQGADFYNAELQGVSLKDAYLEGANFNEAQLEGAALDNAQLQGAWLMQS